jgi:hypothetical protein
MPGKVNPLHPATAGGMDGEERIELMVATAMGTAIYIYKIPKSLPARSKTPLGTEPNFMLH